MEVRGSSLNPSTLEATTCVNDWTWADLRQQEDALDDFEDLFDNYGNGSETGTERSTIDNDDE